MKQSTKSPSIFSYKNYRRFLEDSLTSQKQKGLSQRSLTKRCGLSSPNYFQLVIQSKRNLTPATAKQIADGLNFSDSEKEFFISLVRLEHDETADKTKIKESLHFLTKESKRKKTQDPSIYWTWLNGIIYEMAAMDGFQLTVDHVFSRLSHIATREEINDSIEFMKNKKYLIPIDDQNHYEQAPIKLDVMNDVRRVELQQIHRRYLDLAKHRLNDDLDAREYQGITAAIPVSKIASLKKKIRKFMDEMDVEVEGATPQETVVRIQCCLFKVSQNPK